MIYRVAPRDPPERDVGRPFRFAFGRELRVDPFLEERVPFSEPYRLEPPLFSPELLLGRERSSLRPRPEGRVPSSWRRRLGR